MTNTFHFHGDLPLLLRGKNKGAQSLFLPLNRRTSIKDMIESFGLPHTEIGSIELDGHEIDFNHIVEDGNVYSVLPVPVPWKISSPTILRPNPLSNVSFIVDVNVGRLARYLRAAGFDTLYDPRWDDEYIAQLVGEKQRVLLTRDLRLLMRKQISYGRYIRAIRPAEQLQEVIKLLGIGGQLAPFTRCLECNSLLENVSKKAIVHRLEPLTKKYYTSFSCCKQCDKIYWPGSHREKMQGLFSGK